MTGDDLIQWWKDLQSVNSYFFSPINLPGKIVQIDWADTPSIDVPNLWRAHIHEDSDSYLLVPNGEYVHHAGYYDDVF